MPLMNKRANIFHLKEKKEIISPTNESEEGEKYACAKTRLISVCEM